MERNMKYRNYPIKKKLLISHGIIILLSAVVSIIVMIGMAVVKDKLEGMYKGPFSNMDAIGDIRYALTDILRATDRILAETDRDLEEAYSMLEADVNRDVEILLSAADSLEKNLLSEDSKVKLRAMLQKIDEGEQIRPELMELLKSGKFEEAYSMSFQTYLPLVEEINAMADDLEVQIENVSKDYYTSAETISALLIIVGIVMLGLIVLFSLFVAIRMTKAIVDPIREITEASEQMHRGDMSAADLITYEGGDEIGAVAASLRGTMRNLQSYIEEITAILRDIAHGDLTKDSNEITDFLGDFAEIKESFVFILKRFNATLSDIQESSRQVAGSAGEIAGASSVLAEGATDQASAIEELTATITTVAELAEDSAKTVDAAYHNIRRASDEAEQGRVRMEELTEEMKRIMEISQEIENIITTIEDIASQTNLLSLNASIEAARAGEAGRGFAVVADQIGKLAADSAQSAVNTRELIGKTLEEIEKGNSIAFTTSEAFGKVIEDMQSFAEVAQKTNEKAKDQAAALEQVEQGIDQISQVMQNTASSAQESTVISDDLAREAEELDKQVKRFKLYEA